MSKNFRISDEEEIKLQKKAMEMSMELIQYHKPVMTYNKLLHKIIEIAVDKVAVNEKGEVFLNVKK